MAIEFKLLKLLVCPYNFHQQDAVNSSLNLEVEYVLTVIYSPLIDLCTSLLTILHSVQVKESIHNARALVCCLFNIPIHIPIYPPSLHIMNIILS